VFVKNKINVHIPLIWRNILSFNFDFVNLKFSVILQYLSYISDNFPLINMLENSWSGVQKKVIELKNFVLRL